jgi:HD-like signal output (HDOD) protein
MKRLLFVDDEPRVLQGLQRQLHGYRHEWEMQFVDSGPKALNLLAAAPADVIVTDMMMPGMDGAQLLTEVMKRHPQTVRLVLSGHADREAVLRLVGPAHQYLSKPCNAEELRFAIARALAMRDLLASEQLKRLASRVGSLPSLPTLHLHLTDELRKDEPSVERVANIISRDVAMAAKILQLVNSAFFGLSLPATTVTEAVTYLGLATIRALVLTVQVFSKFDSRSIPEFSIDALAEHCWTTGVVARRIADASQRDAKMDDQCFLAGLLHDIGYLVLAAGLTEEYQRVLAAARESDLPTWQIEQEMLGATHAEVGAYLLGLWGLPAPVVEAVALHHRPRSGLAQTFSPLTAVHVADALIHGQARKHPERCGVAIDRDYIAALGLEARIDEWEELAAAATREAF